MPSVGGPHFVQLDAFVVMPNHLHSILVLAYDTGGRGTACRAPTERFSRPVTGTTHTRTTPWASPWREYLRQRYGI